MKKSLCKGLFLLLILCFVFTGCSKEKEKSDKDKLVEDMLREFDVNDKANYKNSVAMLVGGEAVYVDEVMWYIFLLEDSMRVYSEEYEEQMKEPYWEQYVDGNVTMGQLYTDDIISQIAYNQTIYSLALKDGMKCDEDSIRAEAVTVMANISKDDIEKYGLTDEAYVKMHIKWALVDKYLAKLCSEAEVDLEKIKKEHPIEEFKGKINTEFIIVPYTYADENGDKQVFDNATIDKLNAELESARQEVALGKDMKAVADAYDNVLYYKSSFYEEDKSATSIYKSVATKLSSKEISEVTVEAFSAYVIRRLDDTKDKDYVEYIEGLANEERTIYGEAKAKELTKNISNKLNDNVWKTIGVGKNNS